MKATLQRVTIHQKANKCLTAFPISKSLSRSADRRMGSQNVLCSETLKAVYFQVSFLHAPHYKYISIQWIEENTIWFKFQANMFLQQIQ